MTRGIKRILAMLAHSASATAALSVGTLLMAHSAPAAACLTVPLPCHVTSTFGTRFNPITKSYASEFHHGVDFGCPIGTPDHAAAAGVVAISAHSESAGNWVVINGQGGGTVYKYMHHEKLEVVAGALVNAGQEIALTGNTGRSTGPHMHFQMEVGGKAVDPYPQFCSAPPLKDGVLEGGAMPEGDIVDPGSQAAPPGDSGGIPPKMGMDGSLNQVMADIIASRAMNPDYASQLATLSEPRLYAEYAYLLSIELKLSNERGQHRERILATQAMVELLMAEKTLRPQLEAQRNAAVQAASRK
jgi:murein DD-endopeptidase MepM/ murein hydrolase activator NlpD